MKWGCFDGQTAEKYRSVVVAPADSSVWRRATSDWKSGGGIFSVHGFTGNSLHH